MGTWGYGIFDDDVAMDIRDMFEDALAEGLSVAEATQSVLESEDILLDDMDDGPVILLALAALQLKHGALDPQMRERALAIIDEGEGVERWEENPEALEERKKALQAFKAELS